jgi:hypothetical protein
VIAATLVRVTPDVSGLPVLGQPVAWGTGFLVLVLLAWGPTAQWLGPLVTVAHEGGHIVVLLLTGRGVEHFELTDGGGGATQPVRNGWVSGILSGLAGYTTPPLVGLAGTALVLDGQAWSLLWATILLLLGAWSQFRGALAGIFLLLAGAGIGYVAYTGTPELQTAVAVALVWLMLLGGVRAVAVMSLGPKSDSGRLAQSTWIPAIVWAGVFWTVALLCLWLGGRRLLGL